MTSLELEQSNLIENLKLEKLEQLDIIENLKIEIQELKDKLKKYTNPERNKKLLIQKEIKNIIKIIKN